MKYDYIIVGAGLAGSMLGYLLQKNNYNVVIFEKDFLDKKEKLCAGIVTPKSYNILKAYFPENEFKNAVKAEYKEFYIGGKIEFLFKNVDLKIVSRKKLDSYILNQYIKIGGKVIENSRIQNIDFQKNILISNGVEYQFENLIGADGALSFVRKTLTGKFQERYLVIENFINTDKKNNFTIEFLDGYKGYNWIIPTENELCIGTGNYKCDSYSINEFNELADRCGVINNKKGAFLPTGKDVLLQKNNVYLVGDAAGLTSPVTGEGIYYALYSAEKLFESFQKNKKYSKLMIKKRIKFKVEAFLLKIIANTPIRNFVFRIIRRDNIISRLILKCVKMILLN